MAYILPNIQALRLRLNSMRTNQVILSGKIKTLEKGFFLHPSSSEKSVARTWHDCLERLDLEIKDCEWDLAWCEALLSELQAELKFEEEQEKKEIAKNKTKWMGHYFDQSLRGNVATTEAKAMDEAVQAKTDIEEQEDELHQVSGNLSIEVIELD